jgi:hypothetical protein
MRHPFMSWCAELTLRRLSAQAHLLRRFTEPFLHRIDDSFMLSAFDAPFRTGSTPMLE